MMKIDLLLTEFFNLYGKPDEKPEIYFAPGRVNLIGEHTDYNGGFVFPCALQYGTYLLIRKTNVTSIKLASLNFPDKGSFAADTRLTKQEVRWFNYPLAVMDQFAGRGIRLTGMELLYAGDIPNEAGLSSSASIEMVTAFALNEMLDAIKVLRDRGLIDGIGTQAHYFNVDGISVNTLQNALNSMAKSGVPIYVTELDLKGKPESEANQMNGYKTSFPVYWNHPAVAGITIWGYVEGATWSAGTGILNSNGTERSAMTWLKSYVTGLPDVGYPFSNSQTTGIKQVENPDIISVYPNPVTIGKVNIESKSGEIVQLVELIDSNGKTVKSIKSNQIKTEIEVTGFRK